MTWMDTMEDRLENHVADPERTDNRATRSTFGLKRSRPLQEAILTGALCLIAIWISIYYIHHRALSALQEEIRAGLARNVSAAATTIDGDRHRTFWLKSQKNDPDYLAFLKQMEDIRKASKNIRYIYTNIMMDDRIFFIANPSPQNDADGDGVPDEAPQLMDPYPDAGDALKEALRTHQLTVDKEPYTDQWGTFYSAYAPICDKKGRFVGTLGMDLEMSDFEERIRPIKNALGIAAVVGGVLAFFCALQVWFFRRRQWAYEMQLATTNQELARSNAIINQELEEAEKYVISLFPPAIQSTFPPASTSSPVLSDWIYQSCSELGGDSFGYHWIDDVHFAAYLIDVCGHGVGAALHSVTVISAVRNMILPKVDFTAPGQVVYALNNAFSMEKYNDTFFTVWYGVFDKSTGVLSFSSGGHPPAVLIHGEDAASAEVSLLSTPGLIAGSIPDVDYQTRSVTIAPYNRLYIFSDGVYEIQWADTGAMMTFEEFTRALSNEAPEGKRKVADMLTFARDAQQSDTFADDFTLVELSFSV